MNALGVRLPEDLAGSGVSSVLLARCWPLLRRMCSTAIYCGRKKA